MINTEFPNWKILEQKIKEDIECCKETLARLDTNHEASLILRGEIKALRRQLKLPDTLSRDPQQEFSR